MHKKLRHPQLLERAISYPAAGKASTEGVVHLFLAYNEYEADGITRRVLDDYGITRRILDDYGITRRVLDDYGITRRILDDYGITARVLEGYGITRRVLDDYGITARVLDQYQHAITAELLALYGVTFAMLEDQGITARVLDDYGITRRVLDDYNISDEDLEAARDAFESVIELRMTITKSRPGISIKIDAAYFDVIMDEFWYDADIELIEPDPTLNASFLYVRELAQDNGEMVPWSLQRIGGIFTEFDEDPVHVYVLDSGIYERDLNVVERKDFTMLFTNRDQEFMEEEDILQLDFFDPGTQGNPGDESGHGTHVAGLIGAEQNDEGIRGVARGAMLHSLKVLTEAGQTDITTVMAAVDYVTYQKQQNPTRPMVMNISLGMDLESGAYNALDEAIARAVEAGIVVVVSAGNDGRDATTYSPAHVREAITVGAYTLDDRFAPYSNFGPAVDLLAPGDLIPSLTHLPQEAAAHENVLMSGTSHAAPQVTGAAALYLALHPTATPAEVKQALLDYAQPSVTGAPSGTTTRTVYVGQFAGDGKERALSISKAEWSEKDNALKVKGKGPRLAQVDIVDVGTDVILGSIVVDEKGSWDGMLALAGDAPCAVVARARYQEPVVQAVKKAPEQCLAPFEIKKAKWSSKKQELEVKGSGPQHAAVVLRDAGTQTLIAAGTIDKKGRFGFKVKPLLTTPCIVSVELVAQGDVRERIVSDTGSACATASSVSIKKVQWLGSKLKVTGTAPANSTVDIVSAASGVPLSAIQANPGGNFSVMLEDLPFVPCAVRLEPRDGTAAVTAAVENAPSDCEGALRVTSARWDAATSSLEVHLSGAALAALTLHHGSTGQAFHQNAFDAHGLFTRTFRNMTVVPCVVSVTSGGATAEADVANSPADCGVAP